MEPKKILIVEDDEFLRSLNAKRLETEGFKVSVAVDGQSAIDLIPKELPSLIFLDLLLPGVDGFEVLKNVRANPLPDKWQPVIIVSALGELDNMRKGFDLEADHYLVKPCDIESILKSIRLMKSLLPQRRKKEEMGHN